MDGDKKYLLRYGNIIKDIYFKDPRTEEQVRVRIIGCDEVIYWLEEHNGEVFECERIV